MTRPTDITAIPTLLRLVEREGAIGTIDAMGWQTESAQTMTEQGAEDVLALKANHPTLHREVHLLFDDVKAERLDHLTSAYPTPPDAAHGRLATRPSWITSDSECCGVQGA